MRKRTCCLDHYLSGMSHINYKKSELQYAYGALEPYVDEATMKIHVDVDRASKLNATLKVLASHDAKFENKPVEWFLKNLDSIPQEHRSSLRNNGGAWYNHDLFWKMMRPAVADNAPQSKVSHAIDQAFGSFNDFKQKFHALSTGIYGSGWAWLCVDPNTKQLVLRGTANQDNPLSDGFTPILGLDVWEHAYFLKYHYQRGDYVNNWFHVVEWNFVEELYEQATK